MPNLKLTKLETLVIFLFAIGFIILIGNSIYTQSEPNEKIFIVTWFFGALGGILIFKRTFADFLQKYFPFIYKDIRLNYGKPEHSFKCSLSRVDEWHFRGNSVKFDIFYDFVVISYMNRCLIIKDYNNIEIKKEFLTYCAKITINDVIIECGINKEQADLLNNIKNRS